MKGTSKVIMGATLVMVVSLAIVLGLVLVLLAELYCTLVLHRRQLRINSSNAAATTSSSTSTTTANASSSQPSQSQNPSPTLSRFYTQGVLQAPRSFLFPALSCKDNGEAKNQQSQLHQVNEVHTQESNTSPHQIGLISTSSPSTILLNSPQPIQEIKVPISTDTASNDKARGYVEHLVYISNPIYDNDASRPSRVDTPFETPDSSLSRLETGGSSGDEEIAREHSLPATPPLTPMKKLPAEACSVSLRDARSLGTSGSDSNSHNGLSSSSGSTCTSPSW